MMHSSPVFGEESSLQRARDFLSSDARKNSKDQFVLRVVTPNIRRILLKEDDVVKIGRKTNTSWHLWLFSDCIICAVKQDESTYKLERKLGIATCSISIFQSSIYPNALKISDSGRSFVVSAPTRSQQMELLGLVLNATASLRSSPTSMIDVSSSATFSKLPDSMKFPEMTLPIRRNSWGIDVYDGAVGGAEYEGVITSVGLSPGGQGAVSATPQSCVLCDQVCSTRLKIPLLLENIVP